MLHVTTDLRKSAYKNVTTNKTKHNALWSASANMQPTTTEM